MAPGGGRRIIISGLVAGATLLPAAMAFSQQATPQSTAAQAKPPPRLALSFSTGLNADSNHNLQVNTPDPTTTLDTNVGLTYAAKTRVQSFNASLNALWRLGNTGSSGTSGLQNPTANLSYSFDNGDTRLSLTGDYRKSPVNLLEPLTLADGTLSPTDLVATTGSVVASDAKLSLETGLNAPIGFLLTASTDLRDYPDNSNPNVYNSQTNALSTTLHFRVNPLNQIDLTAGTTTQSYENSSQTYTQQDRLSLGYTRQFTPVLQFQGQLGYDWSRTDQLLFGVFPTQQRSSGFTGSLGLSRKLPDGSASVTLSSQRDTVGVVNTLEAGRVLALPTAKLDATAGFSIRPGYSAQPIGQLSYTAQGPTDKLTAALSRAVTLDANNNDVAYTDLSLVYSHKINPTASLNLNVTANYSGSGGLGTTASVDRQSVSAAYSYQVTPDWNLNAGYTFSHLNASGSGNATSNSVFITLGRKFTLWP